MSDLTIRPAASCRYDAVSLGEVMLRLDPGEGRIRTARSFTASEGGGEYNVTRGLSRPFGLRCGVVTALVDNEIGRLVEQLLLAGGVDPQLVRWTEHDGVGRATRNGLNFTERGFGVRGGVGVSDRSNTAASLLGPGDVDWDHLFGELGVRWFHTGGVFAALSPSTAALVLEAVRSARRHGTIVSYDTNYRASLWRSQGGQPAAEQLNQAVAEHVDVLIGSLHFDPPEVRRSPRLQVDRFTSRVAQLQGDYPDLRVVATTTRKVHSATLNDWGAVAWSRGAGVVKGTHRERLEVLDRVGAGDSFASGLIYGLIEEADLRTAVDYGLAHGALTMTTPGDTSMASKTEVLALAAGADAAVDR